MQKPRLKIYGGKSDSPKEVGHHCDCPYCTYSEEGAASGPTVAPMLPRPDLEDRLSTVIAECLNCKMFEEPHTHPLIDCILENIGGDVDKTVRFMVLCPRCITPMKHHGGYEARVPGVDWEAEGIVNFAPASQPSFDIEHARAEAERFKEFAFELRAPGIPVEAVIHEKKEKP